MSGDGVGKVVRVTGERAKMICLESKLYRTGNGWNVRSVGGVRDDREW